MPNSEARWFKIISFVVTGIIAGLLLADIIYFNELRNGSTLSSTEITSMLIISGIIFAIVIVMFVWSLIRLFVHKDTRQGWSDSAQQKTKNWVTKTDGGVTQKQFDAAGNYVKDTTRKFATSSTEPMVTSQEVAKYNL